ncbi:hypothetical protein [Butyrivibrio sp. AD3002]|uniref:hypothetical protein n=1 Tax=Butyrivibrio sp. AD3002 TaxID=1280670 RepID=UPI0003B35BF7|nr:hypothetical protein [Butyrivibrio sp. AD3002]
MDKTELERRLRKYNNGLVVSGVGIIIFGIWTIIKAIEEIAFGDIDFFEFVTGGNTEIPFMKGIVTGILVLVIILILLWHLYVGGCAILVGRGKKDKKAFLFWAFFALILTFSGFNRFFIETSSDPNDTTIAAFLTDVAFCFAILDMFVSYFLSAKTKKQLGRM